MDNKEYRTIELQGTDYVDDGFRRLIKISSTRGITKYMEISEKEYKQIKKILVKGRLDR